MDLSLGKKGKIKTVILQNVRSNYLVYSGINYCWVLILIYKKDID